MQLQNGTLLHAKARLPESQELHAIPLDDDSFHFHSTKKSL